MLDCEKRYVELFNSVTKAVEILKEAQITALETYFEECARSGKKIDSEFFSSLKLESKDFKRKE